MKKTSRDALRQYITKDGSHIIELMHPEHHASALGINHQSLAEAIIPTGTTTCLHRHTTSEEIYHIMSGQGMMRLDDECFPVGPGDTVCIPPGTPHQVTNTGTDELHILCACSPPYSHDDTELLE